MFCTLEETSPTFLPDGWQPGGNPYTFTFFSPLTLLIFIALNWCPVNDAGDKKEGDQQLMRAWERCGRRGRATRQDAGDKAGDKARDKTCEAGNDFWRRGGAVELDKTWGGGGTHATGKAPGVLTLHPAPQSRPWKQSRRSSQIQIGEKSEVISTTSRTAPPAFQTDPPRD